MRGRADNAACYVQRIGGVGRRVYCRRVDSASAEFRPGYQHVLIRLSLGRTAPRGSAPPVKEAAAIRDDCRHGRPLIEGRNCRDRWCSLFEKVVCRLSDCRACEKREPM